MPVTAVVSEEEMRSGTCLIHIKGKNYVLMLFSSLFSAFLLACFFKWVIRTTGYFNIKLCFVQ